MSHCCRVCFLASLYSFMIRSDYINGLPVSNNRITLLLSLSLSLFFLLVSCHSSVILLPSLDTHQLLASPTMMTTTIVVCLSFSYSQTGDICLMPIRFDDHYIEAVAVESNHVAHRRLSLYRPTMSSFSNDNGETRGDSTCIFNGDNRFSCTICWRPIQSCCLNHLGGRWLLEYISCLVAPHPSVVPSIPRLLSRHTWAELSGYWQNCQMSSLFHYFGTVT